MSRDPTRGFRFSLVDACAIVLGALGAWALRDASPDLAWGIAFALGHFFLFCNVFRVRRRYELAWTAFFLASFAAWRSSGAFSWPAVLATQTPATLLAIAAEVRSAEYHGIFARPRPAA